MTLSPLATVRLHLVETGWQWQDGKLVHDTRRIFLDGFDNRVSLNYSPGSRTEWELRNCIKTTWSLQHRHAVQFPNITTLLEDIYATVNSAKNSSSVINSWYGSR